MISKTNNVFSQTLISSDFGDLHSRAIDETWYKSAILQHEFHKDSFVYSVPFESEIENIDNVVVTGSYAIFPKDSSMEAPGSVVGFQFSHKSFLTVFQNYTSASKVLCNFLLGVTLILLFFSRPLVRIAMSAAKQIL